MSRFMVFPPADRVLSNTGAGTGDGTTGPGIDEVFQVENLRKTRYPTWLYRAAAIGTGVNRYVNGAAGSDSNDGLSLASPKATIQATITACATGDASNKDCILILPGAVPAGMPAGSCGEYNEGDIVTSKAIIVHRYLDSEVVLDGRPAPYASGWTKASSINRWSHAHTCNHVPALNSGQCGDESSSQNFTNTNARWAVDMRCLAAACVTKGGLLIPSATPNRRWTGSAWATCDITSLTFNAGTGLCTAVTSAAHGLTTGDSVTIMNVDDRIDTTAPIDTNYAAYNGCFACTVVNSTTFTYTPASTTLNTPAIASDGSNPIQWTCKHMIRDEDAYYIDSVANQLHIGFDPSGQIVRAATKMTAISFTSTSAEVRGLSARCYAGRYNSQGENFIWGCTTSQVWENCMAAVTAADGWKGSGMTMRYCSSWYTRAHASGLGSATLWRWSARYLNWIPWYYGRPGWHGGLKVVPSGTTGARVLQGHGKYSNGPFLWVDFGGGNNHFLHNLCEYSVKHGNSCEMAQPADATVPIIVAGNVYRDCYFGMTDYGSNDVWYAHNTVSRCGASERYFADSRTPNHNNIRLIAVNNIFAPEAGSDLPGMYLPGLIHTNDTVAGFTAASTWFTQHDGNAYHYPASVSAIVAYGYANWTKSTGSTVLTRAQWLTETGFEGGTSNADQYSTAAGHQFVTNPTIGDYRSTALAATGVVLSSALTIALGNVYGKATATAPKKGSQFYPGCRDVILS